MPTPSSSPRFREFSNLPFELLIAAFTLLPFLILIYFYPTLPDRVPEYLNLHGEVEVWGRKSIASVFRLPLMAFDLQVLCLLTKFGVWQGSVLESTAETEKPGHYRKASLELSGRLMDWFRAFIAIKLGVSSLEVIFFSIERFRFLTTATRATSWAASIMGSAGAVYYGYRLLIVNRRLSESAAEAGAPRQTDRSHVHGGIVYFNPADPSWFTDKYLPNFGNPWVYAFLACLFCLPLLMFWPLLNR